MSGVQVRMHIPFELKNSLIELAKFDGHHIDKLGHVIGEYMVREILNHFRNQTLWDDSPMPPSEASKGGVVTHKRRRDKEGNYVRSKRTGNILTRKVTTKPHPTLIDTSALYGSYHYLVRGGDVVLGSENDRYAAIHHAGGDAGRNHATHIDARPILGVNPRNERDIIHEIVNFLARYE